MIHNDFKELLVLFNKHKVEYLINKPICRHRAVGKMRIVNVCIPPFNPEDELFD